MMWWTRHKFINFPSWDPTLIRGRKQGRIGLHGRCWGKIEYTSFREGYITYSRALIFFSCFICCRILRTVPFLKDLFLKLWYRIHYFCYLRHFCGRKVSIKLRISVSPLNKWKFYAACIYLATMRLNFLKWCTKFVWLITANVLDFLRKLIMI